MDIGILGSLAVGERGVSITPTAPKPRQVLALLALHADRVVTVGTLTEELWGAAPPRSARPTLQTYILQLREHIACALRQGEGGGAGQGEGGGAGQGEGGGAGQGEGGGAVRGEGGGAGQRCAKDVLLTVPGGYLLKGGQGTSDLRDFERLAGLGYRAMDAGDYAGAAARLSEALELWSGPALADVHAGVHLATEIRRLEESRLCALDQRIEADLRLGRHRELLAELTVLVSRYPTHESLCGQYMLALHRSGRRGEALNAYRQLRARLVRSLGLEPSAALAKLQRSILMSGPAGAPAPAGAPTPVGTSAPAGTSAAGRLAPAG
ncbi:AfsR/SARP family transcriptional regulator [Streptomyces sp. BSE7-9]|uniref:AfsR/SARP family transcriptional regulator n=1 Tax=Streptomyces sp. BSE7-9 TaxID=2759948 RepID=UPI0018EEC9AE|nr:AfsR/SARP family transcriptional regulator [Streptomyces sp. BSE7-9]MBJ6641957.1 AfsR/SARP family transcriptional regulator [Streptomyces sp. BSE7-9]MBJ6648214.1 AfsR/SARP family transcriptional regulator [Streptomyces sp. BSE7-9]